jgi:hypothetical protein
MTNPTSNFNWQMPTASDLVTDLPADFETFGQAVDTTLADLKGGTSGQVLSKASNTDMDFTWVTSDDANAIQNAIVDAKGDLIAASAADTPARLAVGSNGETLVADSSATTGLRYQPNFAAGKNKMINGDFGVWQRSTSSAMTDGAYSAPDRYIGVWTAGGGTSTWSRQTFTPGTAPVAGYEGTFFSRTSATSGSASTLIGIAQKVEDVRTFAGQTATFSFWAKADSARTLTIYARQEFGSGGSGDQLIYLSTVSLTTSWQRFSVTGTVPSVSGKTIGTNSRSVLYTYLDAGAASGTPALDIWGYQWEAGNTATAFQTATGTIQGELAACQRYFQQISNTNGDGFCLGQAFSTTQVRFIYPYSEMRTSPSFTISTASDFGLTNASATYSNCSSLTLSGATTKQVQFTGVVASGLVAGNASFIRGNSGSSSYLQLSAEL